MKSVALLFGLLVAATMVTGYGGGEGDGAGEPAPFTIVTTVDFLADPSSGIFNVEQGSDALGCSGGTFVDHPLSEGDFGTGQSGSVLL